MEGDKKMKYDAENTHKSERFISKKIKNRNSIVVLFLLVLNVFFFDVGYLFESNSMVLYFIYTCDS